MEVDIFNRIFLNYIKTTIKKKTHFAYYCRRRFLSAWLKLGNVFVVDK